MTTVQYTLVDISTDYKTFTSVRTLAMQVVYDIIDITAIYPQRWLNNNKMSANNYEFSR